MPKLLKEKINDDYFTFEELCPYLVTRCLAEIDCYAKDELVWEYYDLIVSGWCKEEDLNIGLIEMRGHFLILTEGKTDTEIISKSMKKLKPDICDLFYFSDMENNPFGGTKDIVKFCKGLKSIKYSGNTIVILDNDIAGNKALNEIMTIGLPSLILIKLPDHDSFSKFPTKGTNGEFQTNVNGLAVSIESFLDFKSIENEIFIRWVGWDKNQKKYHGRFDSDIKNRLQSQFFKAIDQNDESYDFSKLNFLIEHIISQAKKAEVREITSINGTNQRAVV